MTAFELHSLLASNRELIANTWNLFLGVHVGILAALGVRSNIAIGRRTILALPFYLGFLFLNYRAQIDNYRYQNVLLTELSRIETAVSSSLDISVFEMGWVTSYLEAIYASCGGFVLILVAAASVSSFLRRRNVDK